MRRSHRRLKQITTTLAGALLLLGVSACGGTGETLEGLEAPEVLERVQADMSAVSSLRVTGEVKSDGTTRSLDLSLDTDNNYVGDYSLGGARSEVLVVDGRLLVRGGADFWAETGLVADEQMAEAFAGQWVGMPGGPQPGNELAGKGGICDLESFMAALPGAPEPGDDFGGMCTMESLLAGIGTVDKNAVTKGETAEIDGVPALELIIDGEQGETRMWVSSGADNHIQKLVHEGAEPDGFSVGDYNEPVDATLPNEDEILDLSGTGS